MKRTRTGSPRRCPRRRPFVVRLWLVGLVTAGALPAQPPVALGPDADGLFDVVTTTCPPPGGQVLGKPDKTVDKDGDKVPDRKYLHVKDRQGQDLQVWCLDHGATGDFAVYASRPGKVDKRIAVCAFVCGQNSWRVEIVQGILKRFRGVNFDPRLKPKGTGGDFEFDFEFDTGRYHVSRTQDKYPQYLRTALLESASLGDGLTDAGFDASVVAVDATAVDEFMAPVLGAPPETPAGVGITAFVSADEFERISGQHLLAVPLTIDGELRELPLRYHSETLRIEEIDVDSQSLLLSLVREEPIVAPDRLTPIVPGGEVSTPDRLSVSIPRELLDRVGPDGRDLLFLVQVDGRPVEAGPSPVLPAPSGLPRVDQVASDTDRLVDLLLPRGARSVAIRGAQVGRHVPLPVIYFDRPPEEACRSCPCGELGTGLVSKQGLRR